MTNRDYIDESLHLLSDFERTDVPNLLSVLGDSSIAAELASPQGIQDGPSGPLFLVKIGLVHLDK
jgi:hypothetical protein